MTIGFAELLAVIKQGGEGVLAYKIYAAAAHAQAIAAPDRAAAWLLLATVAEHFAGRNEEEPLEVEVSATQLDVLRRASDILDTHYAGASATCHLKGVNMAATLFVDGSTRPSPTRP